MSFGIGYNTNSFAAAMGCLPPVKSRDKRGDDYVRNSNLWMTFVPNVVFYASRLDHGTNRSRPSQCGQLRTVIVAAQIARKQPSVGGDEAPLEA
jgi:hypothetical protein